MPKRTDADRLAEALTRAKQIDLRMQLDGAKKLAKVGDWAGVEMAAKRAAAIAAELNESGDERATDAD